MARKYKIPFMLRLVLFLMKFFRPPAHKLSLKQIKKLRKPFPIQFLANWVLGRPIDLHKVEDVDIQVRDTKVPGRVYVPSDEKNLPVIVNYHGGGWVLGNLQQADDYCRRISRAVPAIVVSVEYRKAPENSFPIPLNDAYDAFYWAKEQAPKWGADPERMAVTGDSAGGNLAAAVCLMARDKGSPLPQFQGLIYPATDARLEYPSIEEHAEAPLITRKDIVAFMEAYEGDTGKRYDPYFSPYLADSHQDLPPALIQVAEYDPLLDDGRQYAQALEDAGVEVDLIEYPREIHGFMTFTNHSRLQRKALADMATAFRKYLIPKVH